MSDLFEDSVREFREKFECPKDVELWNKLCVEESIEVIDAVTPVELLKEWCDLVYVHTGILQVIEEIGADADWVSRSLKNHEVVLMANAQARIDSCKINSKTFDEAFKRVHASNMSKLGEDGKPVRREDGKILKGPNYKPPDLSDLAPLEWYPVDKNSNPN